MKRLEVGMRVKKVWLGPSDKLVTRAPIGAEGTIVGQELNYGPYIWHVVYDGITDPIYGYCIATTDMLEPAISSEDAQLMRFMKTITRVDPVQPAIPTKKETIK